MEFKFYVVDNFYGSNYEWLGTETNDNLSLDTEYWGSKKWGNNFKFTRDGSYTEYKISLVYDNAGDDTQGYWKVKVTGVEAAEEKTFNYTGNLYLVGDLSCFEPEDETPPTWPVRTWGDADQGGVNKVLRLISDGEGNYTFKIPAVGIRNDNDDGNHYKNRDNAKDENKSYSFVIVPEEAFSGTESTDNGSGLTISDWSKVMRPTVGTGFSGDAGGKLTSGNSNNFVVKMNGGSYDFTINPQDGTWSVTAKPNERVMYVAVRENGYWRAYQYLIDYATGEGAFNGEHQGSFSTDGTGVLLLHNWKRNDNGGYFYTRNHLKMFRDVGGTNLYPIDGPTPRTPNYIAGWNVAGTYGIIIDPSRGNAQESSSYDNQTTTNNNCYGDLCGSLTLEKIESVPVDMPELANNVIRTYSNVVDLEIPDHYRAYVAHSFDKDTKEGKAEHGTVNLRRIKYIPKSVGVVLVGDDVNYKGTVNFPKYNGTKYYDTEDRTNLWYCKESKYSGVSGNAEFNNYLIGSNNESVTIKNYEGEDENSPSTYTARNFGLNAYSHTKSGKAANVEEGDANDYIGFFRAKGTVKPNLAYLQIPSDPNSKFGYMDYNGQRLDDQPDDQAPSLSKTAITFDDEVGESETTAIKTVSYDNALADHAYYALAGVKVSHPTKGVYIHQGRKVIIK